MRRMLKKRFTKLFQTSTNSMWLSHNNSMVHRQEARQITLIHKAAKASMILQQRILRHFAYIDKETWKGKVEMDRLLLLIEFSVASGSEALYELYRIWGTIMRWDFSVVISTLNFSILKNMLTETKFNLSEAITKSSIVDKTKQYLKWVILSP